MAINYVAKRVAVVFVVILSVALATLLIDVLYPMVDRRIKYAAA